VCVCVISLTYFNSSVVNIQCASSSGVQYCDSNTGLPLAGAPHTVLGGRKRWYPIESTSVRFLGYEETYFKELVHTIVHIHRPVAWTLRQSLRDSTEANILFSWKTPAFCS